MSSQENQPNQPNQPKCFMDFSVLGNDFASFVSDPTSSTSVAWAAANNVLVSHTPEINGVRYHVVRYNRKHKEITDPVGLLRSIIIQDGRIVSVSLPKSRQQDMDTNKDDDNYSGSESTIMYEGPMMNLFYNSKDSRITAANDRADVENYGWQMSTRSVFGGRNSFYEDEAGNKLTFRNMFLEAMPETLLASLNRNRCYSFVIRHPANRDVYPASSPSLVLIASFEQQLSNNNMVWDYYSPTHSSHENINKICHSACEPLTTTDVAPNNRLGVNTVWFAKDGTFYRSKEIEDGYVKKRLVRGSQPKLLFHYLTLRQTRGAVAGYLKNYPEHRQVFDGFRDRIHNFTNELYANYWACFVKKTKNYADSESKFKKPMVCLHQQFKSSNIPHGKHSIVQYVNNLPVPQLMYLLNWEKHEGKKKPTTSDTTNAMESQ
jgi:hypothetical protein